MTILYEKVSEYHDIKVVEEYPIRKLVFGNDFCSDQSAIDLINPNNHIFDFSFLAMHSLLMVQHPLKILVVGLGGGVIPTCMEKYLPNSKIDVIEIDPEIIKIAKEYFFFKETKNLKVYLGDAFDISKNMKGKYDIVIVDAFLSDYIPFHIMSVEFFNTIFKITSKNCVVAVNMANVHPVFYSQVNTIRHVFGNNLYYLKGCKNPNTTMLFATKNKKNIIDNSSLSCDFLVIKPMPLMITSEIKKSKIISVSNVDIV